MRFWGYRPEYRRSIGEVAARLWDEGKRSSCLPRENAHRLVTAWSIVFAGSELRHSHFGDPEHIGEAGHGDVIGLELV